MMEPPKDLKDNRRFRAWVMRKGLANPRAREAFREWCANDISFWVNTFVWQYNPQHREGEVGPFISWGFQDEAFRTILDCIKNGKDLVIEKSREMGASWMCLLAMDWVATFQDWKKFLMVSRSAEAVDNPGDPDCLFWKLDFVHRYMPEWIRPKLTRQKMHFGYDQTRSAITGQASTGKAGVGGRCTAMFVDEFSQIREAKEILHRTSDTTRCRIFNFTHTEIDNAAAEISRSDRYKKLRLHWSEHPEKKVGLYRFDLEANQLEILDKSFDFPPEFQFIQDGKLRSPWYDEQCVRKGSERAVAMDLDINPMGAMSQFFDPLVIANLTATYARPPYWEGEIRYDKESGKAEGLVQCKGGRVKLWILPDAHGKIPVSRYGMGCDLAAGTGATNSCLSIIDANRGEKVLEFADPHIEPTQLAPLAVAIAWTFKDQYGDGAKMAWEASGPGLIFGKHVVEMYSNVYMRKDDFKTFTLETPSKPGWYPSPSAKRLVLEEYRTALATKLLINRSEEALKECLAFRYGKGGSVEHGMIENSGDPSGARDNHGDRTIADALAWKMVSEQGGLGSTSREKTEMIHPNSLAYRNQLADNAKRKDDWVE